MSVSKKLAPYALSAGLFGLVASAAVIAANGSGQGREVELVRPASVVSTPATTTSTTPAATATTTQEEPVKPEPTTTTTEPTVVDEQPEAPSAPATSQKPNVDPAPSKPVEIPLDDPRRQQPPPPIERYNSTGAENGVVVPLPGQTAEPRPDSPSATTSTAP